MNAGSKSQDLEIRRRVFEALSEVANAFSSPARLKIIQCLQQGPKSVEALAEEVGETVANTSQHLQRLGKAGLVLKERKGVSRIYRVSSPRVLRVWEEFQELGHELVHDLNEKEDQLTGKDLRSPIPGDLALSEVKKGRAILVDVRDESESKSTPVPEALSVPLAHLLDAEKFRGLKLPKTKTIYVFCRGRYCAMASDAVRLLLKRGYRAFRLRESAFKLKFMNGVER